MRLRQKYTRARSARQQDGNARLTQCWPAPSPPLPAAFAGSSAAVAHLDEGIASGRRMRSSEANSAIPCGYSTAHARFSQAPPRAALAGTLTLRVGGARPALARLTRRCRWRAAGSCGARSAAAGGGCSDLGSRRVRPIGRACCACRPPTAERLTRSRKRDRSYLDFRERDRSCLNHFA